MKRYPGFQRLSCTCGFIVCMIMSIPLNLNAVAVATNYYVNDGSTGAVLIDSTRITADDTLASVRPCIVIDSQNMQHIAGRDERWPLFNFLAYSAIDLYYRILNTDGFVCAFLPLTTGGTTDARTAGTLPYYDVDSIGKSHIVWTDVRNGIGEVYYA